MTVWSAIELHQHQLNGSVGMRGPGPGGLVRPHQPPLSRRGFSSPLATRITSIIVADGHWLRSHCFYHSSIKRHKPPFSPLSLFVGRG